MPQATRRWISEKVNSLSQSNALRVPFPLGAIFRINFFQSNNVDLVFQVPAGILFGPVGPQNHPPLRRFS